MRLTVRQSRHEENFSFNDTEWIYNRRIS